MTWIQLVTMKTSVIVMPFGRQRKSAISLWKSHFPCAWVRELVTQTKQRDRRITREKSTEREGERDLHNLPFQTSLFKYLCHICYFSVSKHFTRAIFPSLHYITIITPLYFPSLSPPVPLTSSSRALLYGLCQVWIVLGLQRDNLLKAVALPWLCRHPAGVSLCFIFLSKPQRLWLAVSLLKLPPKSFHWSRSSSLFGPKQRCWRVLWPARQSIY